MTKEEIKSLIRFNVELGINHPEVTSDIIFELAAEQVANTVDISLFDSNTVTSEMIDDFFKKIKEINESLLTNLIRSNKVSLSILNKLSKLKFYSDNRSKVEFFSFIATNPNCDTELNLNLFKTVLNYKEGLDTYILSDFVNKPEFPVELIKRIFNLKLEIGENKYEKYYSSIAKFPIKNYIEKSVLKHPQCPQELILNSSDSPLELVIYPNCPKEVFDEALLMVRNTIYSYKEGLTKLVNVNKHINKLIQSTHTNENILMYLWNSLDVSEREIYTQGIYPKKILKLPTLPLSIIDDLLFKSDLYDYIKIILKNSKCDILRLVYAANKFRDNKDIRINILKNSNSNKEVWKLVNLTD